MTPAIAATSNRSGIAPCVGWRCIYPDWSFVIFLLQLAALDLCQMNLLASWLPHNEAPQYLVSVVVKQEDNTTENAEQEDVAWASLSLDTLDTLLDKHHYPEEQKDIEGYHSCLVVAPSATHAHATLD